MTATPALFPLPALAPARSYPPGTQLPMGASASGRAYLAFCAPEIRAAELSILSRAARRLFLGGDERRDEREQGRHHHTREHVSTHVCPP